MNPRQASSLAFLLLCIGCAEKPTNNTDIPVAGYELVWADEVSGEQLDFSKWDYRGLGLRRKAINAKETVALDGEGHLVLTTKRQGDDYLTAMLGTQGKFEAQFGYFECRARLQRQVGHWSAFWLQSPTYGREIGNPAASGAEIDVFEYLCKEGDRVHHAVHWDGYGEHHKTERKWAQVSGLGQGWHTFGLLWTDSTYVFYVDGREAWRTRKAISRQPQYLILSLEVDDWAGDIAAATLPDHFYVDYVRVYQKPGASPR